MEMKETLITLTSDIVAAHVSNNDVSVDSVPGLITNVYDALSGLGQEAEAEEVRPEPAVSIRASVKFRFSSPSRSCAGVISAVPCISCATATASARIAEMTIPRP